jgi:type I restriction enzyme R subunit
MRITGDEQEGKMELDNFIDPESRYPVIATTSKLMTTGVDAQTCKLVVLDQRIKSMTEFKQIIGRGTRINEDYDKFWFSSWTSRKPRSFCRSGLRWRSGADLRAGGDDPPVPPDEPR